MLVSVIMRHSTSSPTSQSKAKKKIYSWPEANLRQVVSDMCSSFIQKHDVSTPVETLWQEFKNICKTCLDIVSSKECLSTANQPWITNRVRHLC